MNTDAVNRVLDRIEYADLFVALEEIRQRRRRKGLFQRCVFWAMATASSDTAGAFDSAYVHKGKS